MTLLGIGESVDTNNSDLSDMAVIFGGEYASRYGQYFGYTLDEIARVLTGTVSHELGHILGLNHVSNSLTLPDTWVMSYPDGFVHTRTDDRVFTTHEQLMAYPNWEFLIGYQNSVASLWSIQ